MQDQMCIGREKVNVLLKNSAKGLAAAALLLSAMTGTAWAQTATDLFCSGCVNSADIENNAVRSVDITNNTIQSVDLRNYDIRSVDMFPNINLGRPGDDGDFTVKTSNGAFGVRLAGDGGNVSNLFSNAQGQSNGLVKAWAMINSSGGVVACFRCNKDTSQTQNIGVGSYEVDFTPLSSSIAGRPRVAVTDIHGTGSSSPGVFSLADRSGDPSKRLCGH